MRNLLEQDHKLDEQIVYLKELIALERSVGRAVVEGIVIGTLATALGAPILALPICLGAVLGKIPTRARLYVKHVQQRWLHYQIDEYHSR